MFQVLLADDEPSVIESLRESIPWEELGLAVAGVASDGKEAAAICAARQIDIALLDIRMPGLSGLELCERLRKTHEKMQLILISGYAEFSYAERAISYGVLGYCLKPLQYDRITALLLKATQNLNQNHGPSATDLLDALDAGDVSLTQRLLRRLGIHGKACRVFVSIGEKPLPLPASDGITIKIGSGQFGYLSNLPLARARLMLWQRDCGILGIGYCAEPVETGQLGAAFASCMECAYQFFVDPALRICTDAEIGSGERAQEFLNMVSQNVEKGRWDVVCEQLSLIQERHLKLFSVRTSLKLCNIIYTGNLFREDENDYYIYSLKQLVTEYGSLSDMLLNLKNAITDAISASGREDGFSNTLFMNLLSYIGENYKKGISLTSAGEALHLSPNYVSQLFKKETGVTFVHYITQLRMEDAIRLLTTTKMPVVDIAEEVGFHDYFYFLKTFKKFTQKTPTQYREEA